MTEAECKIETQKHIDVVRKYIQNFVRRLIIRGYEHDLSKLESPEVELFTKYTPKLATTTYGSEEYCKCLSGLYPALEHHYETYRHHPEHFEHGINDMNLLDIVEMFCDWKAATLRQKDGNILKSISINAERFGIDEQLTQIFINTAKTFDEWEALNEQNNNQDASNVDSSHRD